MFNQNSTRIAPKEQYKNITYNVVKKFLGKIKRLLF